jgi:hypothetical protein
MKVFAHYAGDVGSSSTMNRSEYVCFFFLLSFPFLMIIIVVIPYSLSHFHSHSRYTRFVKDSKIKSSSGRDEHLNGPALDLIFAKVNAPQVDLSSVMKLKGRAKQARESLSSSSLANKRSERSSSTKTAPTVVSQLDLDCSAEGG